MAFATTVDQQNSAIASIAEGVGRASGEARVGAEAMSRVAGVTTDARSTASGVKDLAGSVAVEGLEAQVRQFLNNVVVFFSRKAEHGKNGLAKPATIDDLSDCRLQEHLLRVLKRSFRLAANAFRHFNADDGWAIASHIALSALMALFPFLIVVTALAGFFFGSKELADEAARILLEAWPSQVAAPIARDITGVLTSTRGDVLTLGVVFALYFASSGVESLRIGLNRAYDLKEPRSWWLLRLESIGYVLVGAVAILAFSFLVVLAPLILSTLTQYVPALEQFGDLITFARYAVAIAVLVVALMIVHLWLPAGRRSFGEIAPGILATLLLWLISGAVFGRYLANYAFAYVSMYAGLASAMVALVFLYVCASIFIYGGELNSAIAQARIKER
jgi:membrane protein